MPETKIMAGHEQQKPEICTLPGKEPGNIGLYSITRDTTGKVVFDCDNLDSTERICEPLAAPCPIKEIFNTRLAKESSMVTCETKAGIIRVDVQSETVSTRFITNPSHLTPTEMTMLLLLIHNPGELCSYKTLYQASHEDTSLPENYVRTVRSQMNRLRRKLGDRKTLNGEWMFIANRKQGELRGYATGGYALIMPPPRR